MTYIIATNRGEKGSRKRRGYRVIGSSINIAVVSIRRVSQSEFRVDSYRSSLFGFGAQATILVWIAISGKLLRMTG